MSRKLTDEEVEDLVDKRKLKDYNETPHYENYRHRKKKALPVFVTKEEDDDEDLHL